MSKSYSTKTYVSAFAVGALLMAAGIFAFTQTRDKTPAQPDILASTVVQTSPGAVQPATTVEGERKITVYKSSTCLCCKSWISYLEEAGYEVESKDETDMALIKARYGVPRKMLSCHTGIINGYVVEGHVPVEDIERMLATKPEITGISAPGMPVGSPGMEQGAQKDPYDVVAFRTSGETAVFSSYNK